MARMNEAGDFFIRKALRQPFFNPPNAQYFGVTLGECGHAAGGLVSRLVFWGPAARSDCRGLDR